MQNQAILVSRQWSAEPSTWFILYWSVLQLHKSDVVDKIAKPKTSNLICQNTTNVEC